MQKITDNLLTYLYTLPLTKKTLVIMLDIISLADDTGMAIINHNDITQMSGCADSTYYECLKSLVSYGLIRIDEDTFFKRDIKVTVMDNSYHNGVKAYVDTNRLFFTERHYAFCTSAMIRVYLYFYKRASHSKFANENGNRTYKNTYNHDKSFKVVYEEVLNMTRRQFMRALQGLIINKYIHVGYGIEVGNVKKDIVTLTKRYLKEPKTYITQSGGLNVEIKAPELLRHWKHYINKVLKKFKKSTNEQTIHEIAMLFRQYTKIARAQNKNIYNAIKRAVYVTDNLEIRAVHAALKTYMSKDFNQAFLFEH